MIDHIANMLLSMAAIVSLQTGSPRLACCLMGWIFGVAAGNAFAEWQRRRRLRNA